MGALIVTGEMGGSTGPSCLDYRTGRTIGGIGTVGTMGRIGTGGIVGSMGTGGIVGSMGTGGTAASIRWALRLVWRAVRRR